MQKLMQPLTAVVLGAYALYIAAWYFGLVDGNFALLLMTACIVTGIYWIAEKLHFEPQRQKDAQVLEDATVARQAQLVSQGIRPDEINIAEAKQRLLMQPWWLDWTAGLFPVIAVVFMLRSFVVEPFKIPSGSMIPTLLVGDLILVNKYTYGLRVPVFGTKLTEGNKPQRGDVMVFHYPPQPSLDYIKRVIGVPGDEVAYLNKQLTINGKPVAQTAQPEFLDETRYRKQFEESLPSGAGELTHRLLNDDERPAFVPGASEFPFKDNCRYSIQGVICKVPTGHYFMMGDNRDNSLDSRYWGFVPEANIVGKAFFIWMNFGQFKRIGPFQ